MRRRIWVKRVLAPNHIELLSQTKFVLSILGEDAVKYPHELISTKTRFDRFCKTYHVEAEKVIVTFDSDIPDYILR